MTLLPFQLAAQEVVCNAGFLMVWGMSAVGAGGVVGVMTLLGNYLSNEEGDSE